MGDSSELPYHKVQALLLEILRRMSPGTPKPLAWERAEEILHAVLVAIAIFLRKKFVLRWEKRIDRRIVRLKQRASRELWQCCGTPESARFFEELISFLKSSLEE